MDSTRVQRGEVETKASGSGEVDTAPVDSEDRATEIARDLAAELLQGVRSEGMAKIPSATYRVQFHAEFTFRDAAAIVPYLARLGIGALYASPIFMARPGSTHGYDVIDYGKLNPELGTEDDFADLARTLQDHGLGLILDFVPNHMGIGRATNPWWLDVIENGRDSPFAATFDVDWEPLKPEMRGKVLIPVLGDHYGVVLENGELRLRFEAETGAFWLDYHDNPFPLTPSTYPAILRHRLTDLERSFPVGDVDLLEYQSIIGSLERLPDTSERDPEALAVRSREQIVAKRRLMDVTARSAPIFESVLATVADLNGSSDDPRSFDPLDRVIEGQAFRLAFWRVAAEEINYRRFFAINDLAAIRQEEPSVFAATHELLLRLLADGSATGVRIDHPDGLWDPAGYMATLQRGYLMMRCRQRFEASVDVANDDSITWDDVRDAILGQLIDDETAGVEKPVYLLVEKILEHDEDLPIDWAVHGTTGYEFANATTALFVDPAGRKGFDDLYATFLGEKIRFPDLVYACKHLIMRVALASEVAVLASALDRITEHTRRSRDFTLNNLRDALREVIACFPVYRTYLVCGGDDGGENTPMTERDRRFVDAAIRDARKRNPAVDPTVYGFIRDVVLQNPEDGLSEDQRAERCRFGMKLQQLTGPVMAKGLEDTAFYRYNRLTALNEVGGDPTQFGLSTERFHRQNAERRRHWPHAMLASSTHDTKRSEDVRARIATLSEFPREWRFAVNRWARMNRKHKTGVDGVPAPDRNDEYLLYQTLLGAWPLANGGDDRVVDSEFVDRIGAYVLKAQRESQEHTSWINPNEEYEAASSRFVRTILDPTTAMLFLEDLTSLRATVAHGGAISALGMHLLKLTSPGVPDLYQGTELWDLSLVDPDNRRPVDFAVRERMLDTMLSRTKDRGRLAVDCLDDPMDGAIKLFVTALTLAFRRDHPELFADGGYVGIDAAGAGRDHIVAFARRIDGAAPEAVVVVPRLVHGLLKGEMTMPVGDTVWGDTSLNLAMGARYRNVFTDDIVTVGDEGRVDVAAIFRTFPVALLELLNG